MEWPAMMRKTRLTVMFAERLQAAPEAARDDNSDVGDDSQVAFQVAIIKADTNVD